ncbi:hypothetical protein T265_00839 [Opisthorchis viverrini]|uniref:Uncharacterized protein n=1 Tax=Opisthorchis viverrini TaxID=6198 RepID=A0A075A1A9_OPIVI|nr:hypothetical protein T265_00839 [Opisthorchis viverrini]KER33136.1 hypothetical protein T265_00839 [Opisthorchis viverrini]
MVRARLTALQANSRSRVNVYGKLSSEFTSSSCVRQNYRLSYFLFNFVIDMIKRKLTISL